MISLTIYFFKKSEQNSERILSQMSMSRLSDAFMKEIEEELKWKMYIYIPRSRKIYL